MSKIIRRLIPNPASAPNVETALVLHRLGRLLLTAWTLLLMLIMAWNWWQIGETTRKEALLTLRMTAEKDLSLRQWTARQGGVYVPVSAEIQPIPYLSHLEDRDLVTPGGKQLTLLNPATIMRQIYQLRFDSFGVYNRLTSLTPINPNNAADGWERESLERFAQNRQLTEISGVNEVNGQPALRFILPLFIKEDCLTCHAYQGYELGDLHGALSASTPLAPYTALIRSRQLSHSLGFGLIWLVGLGVVKWSLFHIKTLAANLRRKEDRNCALIEAIPDLLFRYNAQGDYLDAEINGKSPILALLPPSVTRNDFIGRNLAAQLPPEIAAVLLEAIQKVVTTGHMEIVKYNFSAGDKEYFFEDRLVLEGKDQVVSIVRDVTEQKNFEAKLEYLSYHDKLTRLHNRNFFEHELKRYNYSDEYPISIISADVNGLKLINDTLGHAMGDQLLISCGRVLKQAVRSSDILARVGGDEFVAILPATNEAEGHTVVARINNLILQHNQRCPSLPLSVSLGLATAVDPSENLVNTYKIADDRMYKKKLAQRAAAKDEMIDSLIQSARDPLLTDNDYAKLKQICHDLGVKAGLDGEELARLILFAQVKDLGRAAMDDQLLVKSREQMSKEERITWQDHTEKGYRIALASPKLSPLADMILKHHEKWDGSGYPLGLKGEEIPIECRIVSIADAFVTLTAVKAAGTPLGDREAMSMIEAGAGSEFDPQLVTMFLQLGRR